MTRRAGAVLALLALVALLARARSYAEPPERDITTYATIAHEMLGGRELYSDLWDHKPPAIHLAFALAELIAGHGLASIYLLSVAATLAAMVGILLVVRTISSKELPALWAAAVWVVVANDLRLQGNSPNTEVFVNAALVIGTACLSSTWRARAESRWPAVIAAAVLFAVASLFKHVAVVPVALMALAHAWGAPAITVPRRARIAQAAAIGGVGVLAWLGTGAWFLARGRFRAFADAVFTYNRGYAGDLGRNLAAMFDPALLFPPALGFAAPLAALALLGLALQAARRAREGWIVAAYLAGSVMAIALHGFPYAHYYQLLLPPLVIGSALALASLPRLVRLDAAPILGGLVLAVLVAYEARSFMLPAREWSVERYGCEFVLSAELGAELGRHLPPDETFYEWGSETGLYFFSRRPPPSGIFYAMPLLEGPLAPSLRGRLLADLDRAPPAIIIVNRTFPVPAELGDLLRQRYDHAWSESIDPDKTLDVHARRGFAVHPRIPAGHIIATPPRCQRK